MLTKLSVLKTVAISVTALSMTGCATSNSGVQYPLDNVASAIGAAGTRVWTGTKFLFKLKEHGAEQPDEFLDEVDLALMEDGEFNETVIESGEVEPEALVLTSGTEIGTTPTTINLAEEDLSESAVNAVAALDPEDLYHTVDDNETLWDLAKKLTGNATNWQALAAANGLGETGAVYAGMKLRIPADMKRKDLKETPTAVAAADPAQKPLKPEAETVAAAESKVEGEIPESAAFTVAAGETLWDLAARTTGKGSNWVKIATYNDMDVQAASSIRYGQSINVPGKLLTPDVAAAPAPTEEAVEVAETTGEALPKPVEAEELVAEAALPAAENEADQAAVEAVAKVLAPKNKPETITEVAEAPSTTPVTTEMVAQNTAQPTAEELEGQIVTVDANFKAEPPKLEVPKEVAAEQLVADSKAKKDEVMVSGTYYPKAIYNDANFSSSLLMRVSPGTRLKISRAVGPWYEVVTEKGVGYVHSRDTK